MVTATVTDDAGAAATAAATAASSPAYGHIQPGTRVFQLRLSYDWRKTTVAGAKGNHREIFSTVKRRVEARSIFGGRREKVVKVDLPLATAIHECLPANAVVLQIVFDYYNAYVRVYYAIPEQKAEHA